MAQKPFEIQSSILTIGGVDLQAGNTSVVIPGVTQASSYKVEEVEETGAQEYQFTPDSEPVVIDAALYATIVAQGSESGWADFTATTDDEGYIDEIEVNGQGTYTIEASAVASGNDMYAYVGAGSASDRPLVEQDWITIPFRPKMRAGDIETIGGGGGSLTISDGNGTEVDNVNTILINANNFVNLGDGTVGLTNLSGVDGLTGDTTFEPLNEGQVNYQLDIEGQDEESNITLTLYSGNGIGPEALGPGISLGQSIGDSHLAGVVAIGNDDVGFGSKRGGVYIGAKAGWNNVESPQGEYAIAIGTRAAYQFAYDRSITLNATGENLNPAQTDSLYIKPIREVAENTAKALYYNTTTGEVTYADPTGDSVDTNIWVETFASDTPGDNVISATSVEYDADGNVIALFSHDDANNSSRYISVAKFDTSGGKLWQQRFAAGQYSDGWGLAADSTAIYVAGELEGTGSPAEYQVSSLMKLNTANGDVIWMKSYDFGEESHSQVVDVASDGNPVMVGYAYSGGQAFITTTKVDKDTGNIIWSRKLDGQNGEFAYGMAVGPAGEIVVIGWMDNLGVLNAAATLYTDPVSNANWTQNTGINAGALSAAVTFTDGVPNFTNIVDGTGNRNVDDVIGTFNGTGFGGTTPADNMTVKVGTVTAGDEYDKMLVVKYDSAGFIQWQKAVQFDAGFNCTGADADIDSDGNIYICGNYQRSDIGGNPWDLAMSLLKMDGNGAKQWSRRVVGDCQDVATSVVVGPDDCLYLSGVTGNNANSDYTFVIAKYSKSGSVLWQRLLDNTTTWTMSSSWFGSGGGSNIAVKNGYVSISGQIGDPGTPNFTAFIAQVSSAGSLFTTGNWDFKGASFSGLLNNTASDITVTNASKTDSDNGINITTATQSPDTDNSNFLVPTKYVLGTPIGDLTVDGNKLIGTGTNDGFQGLNLAPGPGLATDMYFRIHGGDNPTHLHLSVGDNTTYDQYWGDDNKYLKLDHGGNVIIGTNSKTWTFGDDGTTTFPDATVQTTAFKQGQITVTFVSGVNLTTITSLQLNSKNLIYCLNDPTYTTVEIQSIALPSPAAGQQLTIYNISPQTVALSWVDPRGGNSGYSLTSPGDVVCLQGIERQSSETGGDPGTDWIVVSTNNW